MLGRLLELKNSDKLILDIWAAHGPLVRSLRLRRQLAEKTDFSVKSLLPEIFEPSHLQQTTQRRKN